MLDKASGDNFRKAAELCVQLKMMHEASQNYVNAGKAYRTGGEPAGTAQRHHVTTSVVFINDAIVLVLSECF